MADNPLDLLKMLAGTPVVTTYNYLAYATNARLDKAVGGASNITLTEAEAAHYYLRFTGTLTGNIIVYVPQREKPYLFRNDTTGAFTLTVQPVTSGTGGALTRSLYISGYCDGTNLVLFSALAFSGSNLGIGTTSPQYFVHGIAPDGGFANLTMDTYADSAGAAFFLGGHNRGTLAAPVYLNVNDQIAGVGARTIARNAANSADAELIPAYLVFRIDSKDAQGRMGGAILLYTSSGVSATATEKMRITEEGNQLLGTTTFGTSATKTLVLGNGTAPTTFPADMAQVWSADQEGIAGRGALHIADETGVITSVGSGLLSRNVVEANTAGSGAPNVLTVAESGKVLTNEGATAINYHTLPTAVAGLCYTFVVQDADGLRVVANTGDTIRIAASVSASAGFCQSTTIGNTVTLQAINATEWVALSHEGTWTVT